MRLGGDTRYHTGWLRRLTIQSATVGTLRLITNLPPEQWSAADLGAMYRRRWQIEGCFRWVRC